MSLTHISPADETTVTLTEPLGSARRGSGPGVSPRTPGHPSPPYDPADPLAGLDPEQREVAETLHGPVCVLAGAGTGKTRAITHRVANGVRSGVFVPQRVLAVTFTTRAAGEMRERMRRLGAGGVQTRTFHSAALRQLKFFWPQVVGGEMPRLVASKAPLVAEAASRQRLRPDAALVRDLAAEIEWAKVSRVSADDYPVAAAAAGRSVAATDPATVARVYAAYDETKRARDVLDFEDVLLLTVAMLEDSAPVAEQVRAQYHHFVVDEYQDVNPLQQRLLELWLGARTEVCVVGDPSQTIYSFAGASPSYLLNFPTAFPGATVVRLERDYRSTVPIVALANGLLDAATGPAAAYRLKLRSEVGPGPAPTFAEAADEPTEAADVASRISALIAAGTPAREIAVLFRINAQSAGYEQALSDAGVPYVVRGGERFFDRPEVRQAVTLLRGAARSELDGTDSALPVLTGVAGEPGAARDAAVDPSLNDSGPAPVASVLGERVRDVLASAGWSPQPPSGSGAVRSRWESLSALVQLADDVAAAEPTTGLAALVGELQARAEAQHAPTADAVTLATLHAAKGLEWDAVFVVGLADGTVPLVYAEDDAAIEEERRLLYVGVTRARRQLGLSWALARSPGGRASRRASRFLDTVRPSAGGRTGAAAAPAKQRPSRSSRAAQCRTCGRTLATGAERKTGRCAQCPPTYDDAVFDALREWRSRSAREQSVPAFCVFTDATLVAIAETLPVSERELAKVPGVGSTKLQRYALDVLAICAGSGDR